MSLSDTYARLVGAFLQESLMDMIRVETMEDDQTIVMKDGSLLSMIAMGGALRTADENDLIEIIEKLRIALSPYLSLPGHMLEVNFLRDASAARERLGQVIDRSGHAARSLKLDIDDVLEERKRIFSSSMIAETCILSIYTRPGVLSREEMKEEGANASKRMSGLPAMMRAQVPGKAMDMVVNRHAAVTAALHQILVDVGQEATILSVTAMLQEMRAALYPATAPFKTSWTPRLPEWASSNTPVRKIVNAPETPAEYAGRDFSNLFAPRFDRQLATENAQEEGSRMIRIGDRIFSAIDLTLPPETLPAFNDLVRDITNKQRDLPWRASMRIESGGLASQSLKSMFLGIFSFTSPTHNNRIRDAINTLREINGKVDTVVRLRMTFSTWAEAERVDLLRKYAQTLNGAVQRWGNAQADSITGDQLASIIGGMPGLTTGSTAPVCAAPLSHVLAMAPLSRQASPWDYGPIIYRTNDGVPWFYQPGSSLQNTWVTGIVGTPGSGKSVQLNTMSFATAITPKTAGGRDPVLPLMATLDIGYSSFGPISLIQEALPAHMRHLVVHRKLKMSAEHSINILDTQAGMRRPMTSEKIFIINFLSLVCASSLDEPNPVMRGLISATVDRVYENFSDRGATPRRYRIHEEPEVDVKLEELGFRADHETIWWEAVDFLTAHECYHEASVAQRHAVPTISDLVSAANTDQIASLYGSANDAETGQQMLISFQRNISEIVRDYPILASHTRFSLGEARIVALDLQDVTIAGSGNMERKQTGLMYMLGRQILTRQFFLDKDEFLKAVEQDAMPSIYLERHLRKAKENFESVKVITMDELHRTSGIPMIIAQLAQDIREGRKFNVDIRLASQLIEDFPPAILKNMTCLIVCNASTEDSIDYLDQAYTLSQGERDVMRYELTGPSAKGAPFWAMFSLKGKRPVRQKLNLQLGPVELWAFSTTANDVVLRTALYERLGPRLARSVLARRFPEGSAGKEIENRIKRMEARAHQLGTEGRVDIVGELIDELEKSAYLMSEKQPG